MHGLSSCRYRGTRNLLVESAGKNEIGSVEESADKNGIWSVLEESVDRICWKEGKKSTDEVKQTLLAQGINTSSITMKPLTKMKCWKQTFHWSLQSTTLIVQIMIFRKIMVCLQPWSVWCQPEQKVEYWNCLLHEEWAMHQYDIQY